MNMWRSFSAAILSVFLTSQVFATSWQGVNFPFQLWDGTLQSVSPTARTYYVDGTNGSDSHDGLSADPAHAFKTITHAVDLVNNNNGDTVLIRKGLYKEAVSIERSGTAGTPVTIGSYGDGEVIIDSSPKLPSAWVYHSGTVWKVASLGFLPSCVVVNDVPLREISHGQTPDAPTNIHIPASNSAEWFYDQGGRVGPAGILYADFGTVPGSGDPNAADIIVPVNARPQDVDEKAPIFYDYGCSYLTFRGLTLRGSAYNGVWGYGSHINVLNCKIVFNTRAAIAFFQDGSNTVQDVAKYCLIHDNVLENWPRGNNDNTTGGWPAHVESDVCYQCEFQGNIIYHGGGEGIDHTGNAGNGVLAGSNLIAENVVYDNWSVEMYIVNQPNDIIRNNFTFRHPPSSMSGDSFCPTCTDEYWTQSLPRLLGAGGLVLADEFNAGHPDTAYSALAGTKVYDNILVNSYKAIQDACDDDTTCKSHKLKDTDIHHNTILLPHYLLPGYRQVGIWLSDNSGRNSNNTVTNNITYVFGQADDYLFESDAAGALPGSTAGNNLYCSPAANEDVFMVVGGTAGIPFTNWKSTTGQDSTSVFGDPHLLDPTQFNGSLAAVPVYDPRYALQTASTPADRGARWTTGPADTVPPARPKGLRLRP